ncbi:MAG: DUF401 family protein, partial [Spirochaetales bacterium]|nr:DUF401 family protein [Spirochaetales bacterium]
METLLSAPALLKVLVSLGLILLTNRISKSLPLAIVTGTVLLAFWAGHTGESFLHIAWNRLSERDNLFLILIIFLLIWMSGQMSKTGIMSALVASFQSKVSNRSSMALLPAMVGLLPMPGGALFSAPLVDDCDTEKEVSPLLKGRINYWFRHIWEYWWPLYAGVLLAVELSGLEIYHFVIAGVPVTLFSALGGWFFLLRKVEKKTHRKGGQFDLSSLVPVLLVVTVYILTDLIFPVLGKVSKYLPITCGILTAITYLQIRKPLPWAAWKKIIFSVKTLNLAILVAVIRVYGAFIEAPLPAGGFLVDLMRQELEQTGIPVLTMVLIIPFIAGFTTGIALGMVGAAFPIVIHLAGADPTTAQLLSTAILAYAAGHIGQLVSPVHVCLIVTNEYFETSLGSSLKGLIGPCLSIL